MQDNSSDCHPLPSSDGLSRGLLLQVRGEKHQGLPLQVGSCEYPMVKLLLERLSISLPLSFAFITILFSDNLRDFLICSNREERLRFNLEDFYQEIGYKELLHNLNIYHPYSLLVFIIGTTHTIQYSTTLTKCNFLLSSLFAFPSGPGRIHQNRLVPQKTQPESDRFEADV